MTDPLNDGPDCHARIKQQDAEIRHLQDDLDAKLTLIGMREKRIFDVELELRKYKKSVKHQAKTIRAQDQEQLRLQSEISDLERKISMNAVTESDELHAGRALTLLASLAQALRAGWNVNLEHFLPASGATDARFAACTKRHNPGKFGEGPVCSMEVSERVPETGSPAVDAREGLMLVLDRFLRGAKA